MTDNKKLILYVDDDQDDQYFFSMAIQNINANINVEFAENGDEALAYLLEPSTEVPCVIVLDLNMPYMDGKETLKRLQEEEKLKHIPAVILTSSESPMDKKYFNSQNVDFISKPFQIDYFKDIANQILKKYCEEDLANDQLLST